MEIISRLTQPGDYVVDMFSGTFSTGVTWLSLKKHRRFVGCERDPVAWLAAAENLELVFAQSVLNPSSDIHIPQLESAAELLLAHNPALTRAAEKGSDSKPPTGCPYFRQVPEHILKFLATKLRGMPLSEWAKEYIGGLQTVQCEDIMLCECMVLGLIEAPSKHWNDGSLRVLRPERFGGERLYALFMEQSFTET